MSPYIVPVLFRVELAKYGEKFKQTRFQASTRENRTVFRESSEIRRHGRSGRIRLCDITRGRLRTPATCNVKIFFYREILLN